MATVTILHKSKLSRCSTATSTNTISEHKLHFDLNASAEIRNSAGEIYQYELVRYFCGEGLAHARRRLGLESGISVDIQELSGTIQESHEAGISLAVAVAIAMDLGGKNFQSLLDNQADWTIVPTELGGR